MNIFMKRALAGASAIALGVGFVATSSTAANAVTSTYSFSVDLTINSGIGVDTNSTAGDDGGFLAVTPNVLLRDGDTSTYSYNLNTLADVAATDADLGDDEIFTDLATETAYVLEVKNTGVNDFFDSAQALDSDGNVTGTFVDFSEVIPIGNGDDWVAASGAGQFGFWNTSTGDLYIVSIPSGTVTKSVVSTYADFTGVQPDITNGENDSSIDYNGLLEYDCSSYSIVMLDMDANFSRFGLASATQSLVIENTDNYFDNDNLIVSPTAGRWYAHGENDGESSEFGVNVNGMSEELVSAEATSTITADACSDPTLPNTGVDSAQVGLLAAGAGVLGLMGAAFVVARRRVNG